MKVRAVRGIVGLFLLTQALAGGGCSEAREPDEPPTVEPDVPPEPVHASFDVAVDRGHAALTAQGHPPSIPQPIRSG